LVVGAVLPPRLASEKLTLGMGSVVRNGHGRTRARERFSIIAIDVCHPAEFYVVWLFVVDYVCVEWCVTIAVTIFTQSC
jgi:hypothetical protein